MIKSTIQTAVAAMLVAIGAAGTAHAAGPVLDTGEYLIHFGNYDSATTGYGSALGPVCSGILACDGAATASAPGAAPLTSYDSMGILSILSIVNQTTGNTMYVQGQGGVFLTGIFGGLKDYFVVNAKDDTNPLSVRTTTESVGGTFSIWENTANYKPLVNSAYYVSGTTDLNADLFPGVSNTAPNLWLKGVFSAGAIAGDFTTTYTSTFNSVSFSGGGQGFLDVTGGSALHYFDTNAQVDANGKMHDMFLSTTTKKALPAYIANGWNVQSTGDIVATVPEPSTVALVALGLLVVGGAARRNRT